MASSSAWQLARSQVEWELVEVDVAWDRPNFTTEAGDLVGQHAGSRNLDGVVPIVVIVAECVGEVQDRHFGDLGRVLCHIEVGRLH